MTEINIKYVNPAKEGKKFGTVKTEDGKSYLVPGGIVAQFRTGRQDVAIKTEDWGGKTVEIIHTAPGVTMSQVAITQLGVTTAANTYREPKPASNDNGRPIFVTGVVGRAMGSGKFEMSDIKNLTAFAINAYDELLAA